jgi:4-hydroxybenzoate polyprenyltransferase
MKRFTALCHFFLGAALAMSPLAAAIAIRPEALGEGTLWWLAGFVLLWVGGFDIIYALQDIDCDKRDGLHSVPARLGPTGALWASRLAHFGALAMLVMSAVSSDQLGNAYLAGIGLVTVLLIIEHIAAARGRFSMAFFTVNGVISLILGTLGIIDVLMSSA